MYRYYIGIDTGVNTGYAVYDKEIKQLTVVSTVMIHQAMLALLVIHKDGYSNECMVIVEDARQVRFNTDKAKLQGAGSVKRDAKMWEDFLKDLKFPFQMVRPKKAITKFDADKFKSVTGWEGRTNSHGRDAAMLVFGR